MLTTNVKVRPSFSPHNLLTSTKARFLVNHAMASSTTTAVLWKDYVEVGLPKPEGFVLSHDQIVPQLKDDEVLVSALYISVDPYMRGRMRNQKGYFVGPFVPGQPVTGLALGIVKTSKSQDVPEGSLVSGFLAWQQEQVVPGKAVQVLDTQVLTDKSLPASVYMGALGMTGMTAYASLERIGKPKAGETVFVSGAAGAVGLMVGQLCKHVYGCHVVGSAGSAEKVAELKKYGYDAAFNYKERRPLEALRELCPNGVDVYFDNVGGDHLEAALDLCNNNARVVACGSISGYNDPEESRYGVKNLFHIVTKRILMQGFIVGDFADMRAQFQSDMTQYLKEGKVQHVEHLVEGGLPAAGQAFIDMMRGVNLGKVVVQSGPDPFRKTK